MPLLWVSCPRTLPNTCTFQPSSTDYHLSAHGLQKSRACPLHEHQVFSRTFHSTAPIGSAGVTSNMVGLLLFVTKVCIVSSTTCFAHAVVLSTPLLLHGTHQFTTHGCPHHVVPVECQQFSEHADHLYVGTSLSGKPEVSTRLSDSLSPRHLGCALLHVKC